LVYNGLLGATPFSPNQAFTLELLELYRVQRSRHPNYGYEPFIKSICDHQRVTYIPGMQERFARAFDVYLDIRRSADKRADQVLGRDDPEYRAKHSCAACPKKGDKCPLTLKRLHCMDGGNSFKRRADAGGADKRQYEPEYFAKRDYVDQFSDEGRGKERRVREAVRLARTVAEGDRTGTEARCASNWKAANGKDQDITGCEQTGLFGVLCRHGLVEWLVEMVRSGELAKYQFACTNLVLDTYGEDQGQGYDIGCRTKGTVERAELTGPKAKALRLQWFVDSFHGYAHERECMLDFHPLYRYKSGVGLEDFDGMERFFSWVNRCAGLLRHATSYRWMQFIELTVKQWDADRYASIGTFHRN
ncbi:hypothetical protein PENSPDRAFT_593970, partial [Peniophora sp. CONT]